MAQPTNDIVQQLKREILSFEGYKTALSNNHSFSLGPLDDAFPHHRFPVGALHELLTASKQESAATAGFIAAVIAQFIQPKGVCLWISAAQQVFAPAMIPFGMQPEHCLFVQTTKDQETLWATEEALKCTGIAAVICEVAQPGLTVSRRFQLAMEQTGVTAFLIRPLRHKAATIASVARWRIAPLPSQLPHAIPGMGLPRWRVALQKIRNGKPGSWDIEYANGKFHSVTASHVSAIHQHSQHRKTG
jgi:protein ImuA